MIPSQPLPPYDPLALTLGTGFFPSYVVPTPQFRPDPPQNIFYDFNQASLPSIFSSMELENSNPPPESAGAGAGRSTSLVSSKKRKAPHKTRAEGKTEAIPKPYKWAQPRRAKIYSLEHLLSNGINKISGEVQCKRCDKRYDTVFDLTEKFSEISSYRKKNKSGMHDRAPTRWMTPKLPDCEKCKQKNCVKPVISKKKRGINWLFLLLGEMLGSCKLAELKYFCKHTGNHRTGAKDRVLYLTYLGMCKQLDPNGPFDLDN